MNRVRENVTINPEINFENKREKKKLDKDQ